MFDNLKIVAPGFFAIVLVCCIITFAAAVINYHYSRRKAMKMHPSNRGLPNNDPRKKK